MAENGRFQPGGPGGPGRPAGSKNKITRKADEAFQAAFDELQGDPKANLAQWAKDNPTEFYKLFARKLTTTTENTNRNINEVSPEQAKREAEAFLESTKPEYMGAGILGGLHGPDEAGLSGGTTAPSDSGGAATH